MNINEYKKQYNDKQQAERNQHKYKLWLTRHMLDDTEENRQQYAKHIKIEARKAVLKRINW